MVGDFVEAVDIRNPSLLRLSNIVDIEKYAIKLHYAGCTQGLEYLEVGVLSNVYLAGVVFR